IRFPTRLDRFGRLEISASEIDPASRGIDFLTVHQGFYREEAVMFCAWFGSFLGRRNRRPARRRGAPLRFQPRLEQLCDRTLFALTTTFSGGFLTVTSDGASDTAALTTDGSGNILLNGAAISGAPTITNTSSISLIGAGGNDTLSLNLPGYTGTDT